MQNLNMRKSNCRRFSDQTGQRMNCTQKLQRLRCCGRVLSEQEVSDGTVSGKGKWLPKGCNKGLTNGQGRGQGLANGQGRGQGLANGQIQQD